MIAGKLLGALINGANRFRLCAIVLPLVQINSHFGSHCLGATRSPDLRSRHYISLLKGPLTRSLVRNAHTFTIRRIVTHRLTRAQRGIYLVKNKSINSRLIGNFYPPWLRRVCLNVPPTLAACVPCNTYALVLCVIKTTQMHCTLSFIIILSSTSEICFFGCFATCDEFANWICLGKDYTATS